MPDTYKERHYVCPECGGASGDSGTCETEECSRRGDNLLECSCSDGEHGEVLYASESRTEYQEKE